MLTKNRLHLESVIGVAAGVLVVAVGVALIGPEHFVLAASILQLGLLVARLRHLLH